MYSFIDTSRDDRQIGIMVWYPAKMQTNATPTTYNIDAEPDFSGAPYPLILSSAKVASYFGSHLASYGFIVVGVKGLDVYNPWDENLFNQPGESTLPPTVVTVGCSVVPQQWANRSMLFAKGGYR